MFWDHPFDTGDRDARDHDAADRDIADCDIANRDAGDRDAAAHVKADRDIADCDTANPDEGDRDATNPRSTLLRLSFFVTVFVLVWLDFFIYIAFLFQLGAPLGPGHVLAQAESGGRRLRHILS